MTDAQWVKLLERRIQIKNAKMLPYLKAYHADLEYQFKSGGYEFMDFASSGTPEHLTDEGAKKYLADLADLIADVEDK